MDNRNQSLQEFDQNFDQIAGGNDDNLIDDDIMDDEALNDLGDGLMMTGEDDFEAGDEEQLPDMDEMEFNEGPNYPQKKRLEDIDFDRDSEEDIDDEEDLFSNIQ